MKGVFVILDGGADLPCKQLGQKTPLEVAKTPHLDELAQKSRIDYCYPLKENVAPQSHNAVLSLLGYDPTELPRGPLEAIGAGITLKKGDLAMRANFCTIDNLKDGNILDKRAGRTLTTKEARMLSKAINENVKLKYPFKFYPTVQHRGVLVIRGGFSDNITNADPFYGIGVAFQKEEAKIQYSKPMDDEEDSQLSADLVNDFMKQAHEVLNNHPINIKRAKKGLYAANFINLREAGSSPPKLKKIKGKWMALGYMPLENGIAKASGMTVYFDKSRVKKLSKIDVYSHFNYVLREIIKKTIRMLKKNRNKYDYFYIHFKETDLPGHDNKPLEKVKMIELLDSKFFSFLKKFIKDERLIITADHTTACKYKAHTADPVPVLIYPAHKENHEQRYTEEWGLKGKKIYGRKLLEQNFF